MKFVSISYLFQFKHDSAEVSVGLKLCFAHLWYEDSNYFELAGNFL